MKFKVIRSFSAPGLVKGGSPQGTLPGNFLFIVTTDQLDKDEQNLPETSMASSNLSKHTAECHSCGDGDADSDRSATSNATFVSLESLVAGSTSVVSSSSVKEQIDPRLVSFAGDKPRPRAWTEKPLAVFNYVDDFLGIEKLFTGNGIMSISQQKMEVRVRARQPELLPNSRNKHPCGGDVSQHQEDPDAMYLGCPPPM